MDFRREGGKVGRHLGHGRGNVAQVEEYERGSGKRERYTERNDTSPPPADDQQARRHRRHRGDHDGDCVPTL